MNLNTTFKALAFSIAAFTTSAMLAQAPALKLMTDQLKGIKVGDDYKIFKMSGEGLVAQVPQKPKGFKDAFSPNIVVSKAAYTSDSVDAWGNPQIVELEFAREGGDIEAKIGKTGGDAPYHVEAFDRVNSGVIAIVIDGDIYLMKGLGYATPTGATGPYIEYIISKKKLAGIKGDEKETPKYQEKVDAYLKGMAVEKEKIIAEATEKRRKDNSLEGRDVKSIELIMKSESVIPGENTAIGVIANLKDGSQLKTLGFAKGGTFWSDYKITVTGGTFNRGSITTSEEFSASNKDQVTFTIQSVYKPEFKISKTVNVSYTHSYYFSYAQDGMYGYPGANGSKGHCQKGITAGNGKDGNNGGIGTSVGAITVKIAPYTHAQTKEALLKYEINGPGESRHFVVTPSTSVKVNANGGNGGSGGSGGKAGDVSNSRSAGEPDCNCSSSAMYMGQGGDGGNGGSGGNGGTVTVIIDPSVTSNAFVASAEAGFGGNGGAFGDTDAASGCHNEKSVKAVRDSKKGKAGAAGKNGMKGSITTKKEKVTFTW
ncbi:MAG TPA: hypothetical protein VGF30_12725 [Bacteroidia bacterium]